MVKERLQEREVGKNKDQEEKELFKSMKTWGQLSASLQSH